MPAQDPGRKTTERRFSQLTSNHPAISNPNQKHGGKSMSNKSSWMRIVILTVLIAMVLSACAPAAPAPIEFEIPEGSQSVEPVAEKPASVEPSGEAAAPAAPAAEEPAAEPAPATTRKGGWLDTITIVEESTAEAAVSRIKAGELDMHAQSMSDAEMLKQIQADPNMQAFEFAGTCDEFTFNPSGPVLGNGSLNPFAEPKVREAINWLIDRNYIGQEIMGGLGKPKVLPIMGGFPEYARYLEKARELEAKYAFNPDKAEEIIAIEMEKMGAELVGGKWQYNGKPVELIGVIRTEDERRELGDYLSNALEDIGFTVRREYKTSSEASPLWLRSNPNDGQWHFYTGGWIVNWVLRDESGQFDDMYTTRSPMAGTPLWDAYRPAAEFDAVADRLKRNDYNNMQERAELFERALELAMEDSVRVWIVDELSYSPMRSDVVVAGDLGAGIQAGMLWPFTVRRDGVEGGSMTISNSQILVDPWNPIGGSNFVTDAMVQRATSDRATLMDPFTGLPRPQRIERAELSVLNGLPISNQSDWLDLQFVNENVVPADAYVDWDAVEQRWITAGEKFPEGLTSKAKITVYYPEEIYDIIWHDGSKFSIADIMMMWILSFDQAKADSAIYDESIVPYFEAMLESYKGQRIVSERPLVIEKYTDTIWLDAEENVFQWLEFWTEYNYGSGAWHNIGLGIMAEAEGELAFNASKADDREVEWTSFVSGPSLQIMKAQLDKAAADSYIPYAPVLGQYVTADEAAARWQNLNAWYAAHNHFWIGTGPYFLDRVFPVESMLVLKHNPNYIDFADKWSAFSEPRFPNVQIDGPGRLKIGQEASFDLFITFKGEDYAAEDMDKVKVLVFDANGELILSDEAVAVRDGLWQVTLSAEETALLEVGSNRMEVAAASKLVSFPTFTSIEFVTVP
jgi:peptide/nickel transport system substrate-binding protein